MAVIKTIQEESLTAIGNAIRAKTGKADLLEFPNGMVEAIAGITTGSEDNLLKKHIEQTESYEIKASDILGLTQIDSYAFYDTPVKKIELPPTVTRINSYGIYNCHELSELILPKNLKTIQSYGIYIYSGVNSLRNLTFGPVPPSITSSSLTKHSSISYHVPGEGYDAYLAAPEWGTTYLSQLVIDGRYVSPLSQRAVFQYNASKTYTLSLTNYEEAPEVTITADTPGIVNITDIAVSTTEVSFTINSLETEGVTIVTVSIPGSNGYTFNRQMRIEVYEGIPDPAYTVEIPSDVTYGFVLGDDGYYANTNQKKGSTYAYCVVNISNPAGLPVHFDCIQDGEKGWDFGMLSKPNKTIAKSSADSSTSSDVYQHFKNAAASATTVTTVTYTDAVGDCFITIKYRKDGAGDAGTDTFKFKVRFG